MIKELPHGTKFAYIELIKLISVEMRIFINTYNASQLSLKMKVRSLDTTLRIKL